MKYKFEIYFSYYIYLNMYSPWVSPNNPNKPNNPSQKTPAWPCTQNFHQRNQSFELKKDPPRYGWIPCTSSRFCSSKRLGTKSSTGSLTVRPWTWMVGKTILTFWRVTFPVFFLNFGGCIEMEGYLEGEESWFLFDTKGWYDVIRWYEDTWRYTQFWMSSLFVFGYV